MIFIFIILFLVPLYLSKPIQKLFAKKPIEFGDDYLFEDFVCNDFFVPEKYQIDHPLGMPGVIIPEDSFLPDFRFKQISSGYEFCIKAKYIAKTDGDIFEWCCKQDFSFLKDLIENQPQPKLFIIIGFGGPANFPDEIYLIPFSSFKDGMFEPVENSKYKVRYNNNDIDFAFY